MPKAKKKKIAPTATKKITKTTTKRATTNRNKKTTKKRTPSKKRVTTLKVSVPKIPVPKVSVPKVSVPKVPERGSRVSVPRVSVKVSVAKASPPRVAKPKLSKFAQRLLDEWRQLDLPRSDAKVVVAVSGGADSTSLLLALDELIKNKKLDVAPIVAHLDHGLRAASVQDAQWVKNLAKELGYGAVLRRVDIKNSRERKENLEQAARDARYEFLHKTAVDKNSKLVLTGHTLDDQAETILLRLLRGSAAEGLSGTPVVRELQQYSKVQLVRPLMRWALRAETEDYCRARQVEFRMDEMNADESFSRVRVRNQLLPLMKSFNNRIVEALSRTAALLGEDAAALAGQAAKVLESLTQNVDPEAQNVDLESETNPPSLNVSVLLEAPAAVRRRVLRQWIQQSRGDLRRVEMVHLLAVEKLLTGERGGRVAELPGGMTVTRKRGMLEISDKEVEKGRGDL